MYSYYAELMFTFYFFLNLFQLAVPPQKLDTLELCFATSYPIPLFLSTAAAVEVK